MCFLKRLGDSSSGFSLSQFVRFLHVIPDRLDDDDDEIRSLCGALAVVRLLELTKIHWIITINGTNNIWKYELLYELL